MEASGETAVRDPARVALEYAACFVDELAREGVAHCVVCPGSRSTPLTLAAATQPAIRVWTHVDERSAAYFALGMAKALRAPVAVVCTSGTAAANFLPAVVEAHHAGVPLLILTADRPPELRDTGALQAIDQLKMYGTFVKWFFEMSLPEAGEGALRLARDVATRAVIRSLSGGCGAVHVNFPFREPLVPIDAAEGRIVPRPSSTPFQSKRMLTTGAMNDLAADVAAAERGLLICGPQDDPEFPDAILALAQATGFPILADPLSQLRCGLSARSRVSGSQQVLSVENYDVFLRSRRIGSLLQPDLVLRFGMTPTSKALLAYLARAADARQMTIGSGDNDPTRSVSDHIDADAASVADALSVRLATRSQMNSRWFGRWKHVSTTTRVVVDAHLAAIDRLAEPKVFPLLAELLPPDSLLYAGNSMPIRDLDAFFPTRREPLRMMGNRGVNGIDGVVSSALGAGAALCRRVVLVIGDLSFYHDMNGLLAAKVHGMDATIVLLNNDGGGIFSFLPQADHPSTFEPYFAVPTGLDFRPAVEMYQGRFRTPGNWDELRHELVDSWTTPGLTVVEVRTDRDENVAAHRAIWDAVAQALDDSVTTAER